MTGSGAAPMNAQPSPYACHILVCVNDRQGASPSCADGLGMALKDALKSGIEARGWKGRVRVSHSGCMGLCARGPNVMLYPQAVWFGAVAPGDVGRILDRVAEFLAAGS